jgi:hypothetical protein
MLSPPPHHRAKPTGPIYSHSSFAKSAPNILRSRAPDTVSSGRYDVYPDVSSRGQSVLGQVRRFPGNIPGEYESDEDEEELSAHTSQLIQTDVHAVTPFPLQPYLEANHVYDDHRQEQVTTTPRSRDPSTSTYLSTPTTAASSILRSPTTTHTSSTYSPHLVPPNTQQPGYPSRARPGTGSYVDSFVQSIGQSSTGSSVYYGSSGLRSAIQSGYGIPCVFLESTDYGSFDRSHRNQHGSSSRIHDPPSSSRNRPRFEHHESRG